MSGRRSLVEQHRQAITDAVHRHRGRSVAIFGSVARGDDNESSDIDFLVEFEPSSSLFDLLHLRDELEELLGHPVDVVSAGGLKPRDEHIRREATPHHRSGTPASSSEIPSFDEQRSAFSRSSVKRQTC